MGQVLHASSMLSSTRGSPCSTPFLQCRMIVSTTATAAPAATPSAGAMMCSVGSPAPSSIVGSNGIALLSPVTESRRNGANPLLIVAVMLSRSLAS